MNRVLRVLVGFLGVEDGQIAPPVVGEVARYELTFTERARDEPDATGSTVHARADLAHRPARRRVGGHLVRTPAGAGRGGAARGTRGQPGPLDPWPEDGPVHHRHQHWVLTELDPGTLEPRGSTPVPGVVRDVGVSEDGSVWTVAAGLRRCRGDGIPAELVDVAVLLDRSGQVPTWGWPDD